VLKRWHFTGGTLLSSTVPQLVLPYILARSHIFGDNLCSWWPQIIYSDNLDNIIQITRISRIIWKGKNIEARLHIRNLGISTDGAAARRREEIRRKKLNKSRREKTDGAEGVWTSADCWCIVSKTLMNLGETRHHPQIDYSHQQLSVKPAAKLRDQSTIGQPATKARGVESISTYLHRSGYRNAERYNELKGVCYHLLHAYHNGTTIGLCMRLWHTAGTSSRWLGGSGLQR